MSQPQSATRQKEDLEAVWLNPEDYSHWDAFVENHPLGLAYHSSSWKKTLERAFKHIKGHFLALRTAGSGEIVAGVAVYSIKSWLLGNRMHP